MGKPAPAARKLEETGGPEETELAAGGPEEPREPEEADQAAGALKELRGSGAPAAASSLSLSDC